MNIVDKFHIEITKIPSPEKKFWETLNISIFQKDENCPLSTKIGEYTRNYPNNYRAFHPFMKDGKEYALYSTHYTATQVMELPSCKEIAAENPCARGFCPVDFYVPYDPKYGINGHFGFVAGCNWGDDHSWKIQYLDLSEIEKGLIKRDARFGYIHIPSKSIPLKDCIDMDYMCLNEVDPEDNDYRVLIKAGVEFDIRNGKHHD